MKNNLANKLIPVAVILVTIGITAGALATKKHAEDVRANAVNPPKSALGVSVSVATVELKPRSVTVRVNGFLAPAETRTVSPELSGYIQTQHFEISDAVKKGIPLFQIDDTLSKIAVEKSEASLDQAKGQLSLAEIKLDKVQDMGTAAIPIERDKAVSEHKVAIAGVRAAEATHHEAKVLFEKTILRSPISGLVSRIYRRQGEFAHAGQPLIELIETNTLKLLVQLDDREVVMFSPGDPAQISIPALPTKSFQGKILRIFPSAALDSRKFELEIEIANSSGELRPGFYAEARLTAIPKGNGSQVPAIPRLAIVDINEQEHCFLVRHDASAGRDTAYLTPVETVPLLGAPQFAQVISGLEVGDRVITSGLQHVTDKGPVLVRD